MCTTRSPGLSGISPEKWCIQGSGIIGVHTVSDYCWTSCIGTWLLSDRTWSLRLIRNNLLFPLCFELMTCIMGSWNTWLVFHVLGDHFSLHNRLGLVLGLNYLYLIWSCFREHGWLLHQLPCQQFPQMVGTFTFVESCSFLSKQCGTHTIILVPCGT